MRSGHSTIPGEERDILQGEFWNLNSFGIWYSKIGRTVKKMKRVVLLFSFIALACMIAAVGATTGVVSVTNPQDAAALVYVSGYDLTPGVFYPDETAP